MLPRALIVSPEGSTHADTSAAWGGLLDYVATVDLRVVYCWCMAAVYLSWWQDDKRSQRSEVEEGMYLHEQWRKFRNFRVERSGPAECVQQQYLIS